MNKSEIKLDLSDVSIAANLCQPADPDAMVIFVHDTGSSHLNAKNNFVADIFSQNNLSTLIVDLFTPEERENQNNNLNIELLKTRLIRVTEKAIEQFAFNNLPVGYFGIDYGAVVAFEAAAFLGDTIKAIVIRGGQMNFAKNLKEIQTPTLLIAGSLDNDTIELSKKAYGELACDKKIEIVDGASNSFDEPGALNEVANLASAWFDLYLSNNKMNNNVF